MSESSSEANPARRLTHHRFLREGMLVGLVIGASALAACNPGPAPLPTTAPATKAPTTTSAVAGQPRRGGTLNAAAEVDPVSLVPTSSSFSGLEAYDPVYESLTNAMIAIGIVYAPTFARIARGPALAVMNLPYIDAARTLGAPDWRIMLRHVLPNVSAPLLVQTTVSLSTAILTEAARSFLGLGTQPPTPSWGLMLGDGLRAVLDPRIQTLL